MDTIRKIEAKEIERFAELQAQAYCGLGVGKYRLNLYNNLFTKSMALYSENTYGYFRGGQLLGGLRLIDYHMNLRGNAIPAGGIASVAVDVLNKKEKCAKEMMAYALETFREQKRHMVLLYPFKTQFYKKMGFGHMTYLYEYKVQPANFKSYGSKDHLMHLDEGFKDTITTCYDKFYLKNNGLLSKSNFDHERFFSENRRTVGFIRDGEVLGYINYTFDSEYAFKNNMVIHEFVYLEPDVLREFSTFLNSQADQFQYIRIHTGDPYFHFLVESPENGHCSAFDSFKNEFRESAVGLMCRVVNTKGIFDDLKGVNFGGQNLELKLHILDDFVDENNGSVYLKFKDGQVDLNEVDKYQVELTLTVEHFSSLIAGAITFDKLHEYGMLKLSNEDFNEELKRIFNVNSAPLCYTFF